MPNYKNQEEAINHHKDYDVDTEAEGKYNCYDIYSEHKNRVKFLMNSIPEDSHVLEIGCNSGGLLRLISEQRKGYCVGLEISEKLAEKAKAKGFNVTIGQAENLPWEDNKFDVVVMTEVLEHIYQPGLALKEAHRVLKPGGVFVGSVPHPKGQNSKRGTTAKHRWHCHIFKEAELSELLKKYFCEIYTENISHYNDQENTAQWMGWICKKEA